MTNLLPLLLLLHEAASSGYGDCTCSCCAKVHPLAECTPQIVGHNTLSSCSSCSAGFCAHQWPAACPSGPTWGGQYDFGGHTSFQCDGRDGDVVHTAEGGGAGVMLLAVMGCCCWWCCQWRQRYAAVAPVPMGQPVGPSHSPSPALIISRHPPCSCSRSRSRCAGVPLMAVGPSLLRGPSLARQ